MPILNGAFGAAPKINNPGNGNVSTFWLRDFSYLRMKSISVSYRIAEKYLAKAGFIKGARIYGSIENPFYIYNPNKDYDPSKGGASGSAYPILRTVATGVTVTF
jgi:hypothetical protein